MQRYGKSAHRLVLSAILLLMALNVAPAHLAYCIGTDDLDGHWAAEALLSAISLNVIRGYPDGTMKPDAVVTRSEIAAMICRTLDEEENAQTAARLLPVFADVSSEHWASGYIRVAYEAGIIRGDGNGLCRPQEAVSRAELAAILARTVRIMSIEVTDGDSPAFVDSASIPAWAVDDVSLISRLGLMLGDDKGRFRPGDGSSRAEVATVLMRLADLRGHRWDLSGTVLYVDAESGVLHLQCFTGRVSVRSGSDTAYFRASRRAYLSEIKSGDVVSVILRRDAQARAALVAIS